MTWYAKQQPIDDFDLAILIRVLGVSESGIAWCVKWIDHECDLSRVDARMAARLAVRAWCDSQTGGDQ